MFSERPTFFIQNNTGDCFKQDFVSRLKLVCTQYENAVALVQGGLFTHTYNLALDGVAQVEEVAGILLVQDDQVDCDMVAAPIGEGLQGFDQQGRLAVMDAHQQNGVITRDTEGPQARLPLLVLGQDMRCGA